MVLGLSREEQVLIWGLVEQALELYQKDLASKYNGDPRWTDAEDGVFLRTEIQRCYQVKSKMTAMGFKP